MILVAGAGRNVGKTTLCCRVIEILSKKEIVTAIKVSSHHHQISIKQKIIFEEKGLTISREEDLYSSKDSSRFLQSGATTSLFVQVTDASLPLLLKWIIENIQGRIVCESGTLGGYIQPQKAIFVDCVNPVKLPKWEFPFETTLFENEQFRPDIGILLKEIILTSSEYGI
ncbi:MAG: hypothetical protein PF541_17930 [Prolixibacteraceae bacterium]|nr:hypothetical protein [Prolixibacteraceae bacterium]